jgi:hypothetical protein
VYPGCIGTTTGIADAQATGLCRYIEEAGTPAGALAPVGSSHDFTVASVFCIPKTSSVLINGSAALPGPGAISLVGQARLNP